MPCWFTVTWDASWSLARLRCRRPRLSALNFIHVRESTAHLCQDLPHMPVQVDHHAANQHAHALVA